MSGNFPECLKFSTVSQNFPKYLASFQSVHKLSRKLRNLPECLETFQIVHKLCRISPNFLGYIESFQSARKLHYNGGVSSWICVNQWGGWDMSTQSVYAERKSRFKKRGPWKTLRRFFFMKMFMNLILCVVVVVTQYPAMYEVRGLCQTFVYLSSKYVESAWARRGRVWLGLEHGVAGSRHRTWCSSIFLFNNYVCHCS